VTGSSGSVTLQFDSIDALNFTTTPDGDDTDLSIAPCYCRGTLILTERGEVAVEDLAIGDRVVMLSGAAKPIRWIGQRTYDGRFVAGNRAILPIRVAAGALGDGAPRRDLWVSPGHALYIDEVLVQAEQLVSGATIIQEIAVERLEYFHIELDAHDILFADSAPAESYVDCDNRGKFHNAADFAFLYPDDDRPRWQYCAPLLQWGSPKPNAIRAALLEHVATLGLRLDLDPDLHLVVDGAVVRPETVSGGLYRFAIPADSDAASTTWLSIPSDCSTRWIQKPSRPASWIVMTGKSRPVRACAFSFS
jgi:Hint domain